MDLVVASNVLHDTRLPHSLAHIRAVLRPGGVLLMVELTRPTAWWHVCFGGLLGMWKFALDPSDCRTDRFWLARDEWTALLHSVGFKRAFTVADGEPEFENSVVVAQAPAVFDVESTGPPICVAAHAPQSRPFPLSGATPHESKAIAAHIAILTPLFSHRPRGASSLASQRWRLSTWPRCHLRPRLRRCRFRVQLMPPAGWPRAKRRSAR